METIRLKFQNTKPLSTNDIHDPIRRGNYAVKIKSKKYTQYIKHINILLQEYQEKLDKFAAAFDPSREVIRAKFIIYDPRFLTKKGLLSKNSIDADNCLKATIDIIFKAMPGLNDAYLVDPHPMKTKSPDDAHHIEILFFKETIKKYLEQF